MLKISLLWNYFHFHGSSLIPNDILLSLEKDEFVYPDFSETSRSNVGK